MALEKREKETTCDYNILKIKMRYLLEYKVMMSNLYMSSVCCIHSRRFQVYVMVQ